MQQLEDSLNSLTMQNKQYKCICGADLIEVEADSTDTKEISINSLKKSYRCKNNLELHKMDLCQIPGCIDPLIFCGLRSQMECFLMHIIWKHHNMGTTMENGNLYAAVRGEETYGLLVDMSSVIIIIPQFLGLICETPLESVFLDLFSDLRTYPLDDDGPHISAADGGWFLINYWDENFNDLINILSNRIDYWCVLCGIDSPDGYYGNLPPLEVYALHIRETHAATLPTVASPRSLGFAGANPSLTG